MFRSSLFLTLLLIVFKQNISFSQVNKKVFYRNDRFVLEYNKQTLPGDNYAATGFKLYEFFDGKLVHSDSSNRNTIIPTCKHFLELSHYGCSEGYEDEYSSINYFFGSSINKKRIIIRNDESHNGYYFSEGNEEEQTYYDDENSQKKYDLTQILFPDSVFISSRVKGSKNQQSFRLDYIKLNEMGNSEAKDFIANLDVESIENHLVFHPESNRFERTEKVLQTSKLREDQTFDINGNVYNTVEIDGQVWMAENLRSRHFSNGDEIRFSNNFTEWSSLNTPCISLGFNDRSADSSYGYFYNGYTLVDNRNVCPYDFYVPTKNDVAHLYNNINNTGETARIKKNGVAKHKVYPRIFAPVIETIGTAITASIYGVAGAVDITGNAVWLVSDFFLLGPVLGWKRYKWETTDSLTMKTTKHSRLTYDPLPTYSGYTLVGGLWDDGDDPFHLILLPAYPLTKEHYFKQSYDDEGEGYRKYSHIDKLRSSDNNKLTNEYKFNLSNDNTILMYELSEIEREQMNNEEEYYNGYGSEVILPFTNGNRIQFWGNRYNHELQQNGVTEGSYFPNRLGAKLRCVKY
jgi:hypothetical protein